MGAKVNIFRQKIWKTKYADDKFSLYIRQRDGKCVRCGRSNLPLDCSHFWKRGESATRFDRRNCVALCRECHTIWERRKNNEYRLFMIRWLGKEVYDELEILARTFKNRREAVLEFMQNYKLWITELKSDGLTYIIDS